jgi:integrase
VTGTVRQRGKNSYQIAYWVGLQPCQRCIECNHREWTTTGRSPRCPQCGGEMQQRVERRQQFRGGFRTKREAQRALIDALSALNKGDYVEPTRQSVLDYLQDDWLPSRQPKPGGGRGHRGQLGIGTWHEYRGLIRNYIAPRIGAISLQRLTAADLGRLYDELEHSGGRGGRALAPRTVLSVHRLLHKAFNDAVRQGRLGRNPAALVEAPSANEASTAIWTVEQLRAYLRHVADDPFYAAWLLFATTGMRRGEVAALTWPDIDLDAATLRVVMTLGVVDGKATWKPRPKSKAGERTMSLDPATVLALRSHRKVQAEQRLQVGAAWQSRQIDWRGQHRDDLVFTWPDGGLTHPERFSRWFRQHCAAAGLPRIRLHDVRHTYASAGLSAATGWHEVKVISNRLGHSSIGFTLDTYAHVLPSADEQTAHTLARVILGE